MGIGKSLGSAPMSESERQYLATKGIESLPSQALSLLRTFERQIEELRSRSIDQLFDDEPELLRRKGIDPANWAEQFKLYPIVSDVSSEPTGNSISDYFREQFKGRKVVTHNPILLHRGAQVIRLSLWIGHLLNENRRSGSASHDWRYIVIK